jgi:hypothetical protein
MKKLIVLLAVLLLASPALATVNIIIANEGGKAAIKYQTTGEKVRAFALDITVTPGSTITAVSDFIKGESTAAKPGYGIFPANFARYITVGADGEVANWDVNGYTPVAAGTDTGALGGLGTAGVTIEMGSLYYPTSDTSPNAPGTSGTLCKLAVSGPCKMTAVLNAVRGNVVLTDPAAAASVVTTQATNVDVGGVAECFPSADPKYNDWVALGKPDCWCYARQCHGDADGKAQGAEKSGIYYVGTTDLNVMMVAWQVKEPPFGPGIASVVEPVSGVHGICADFARDQQGADKSGVYRVGTNDLNILLDKWLVKEPTFGLGVPPDCGGNKVPQ